MGLELVIHCLPCGYYHVLGRWDSSNYQQMNIVSAPLCRHFDFSILQNSINTIHQARPLMSYVHSEDMHEITIRFYWKENFLKNGFEACSRLPNL